MHWRGSINVSPTGEFGVDDGLKLPDVLFIRAPPNQCRIVLGIKLR
jgi:hypothetical protein